MFFHFLGSKTYAIDGERIKGRGMKKWGDKYTIQHLPLDGDLILATGSWLNAVVVRLVDWLEIVLGG